MPTTGKYSVKAYRCRFCGHESKIGTNHWGEVYSRCTECAWRRPGEPHIHDCLETMPEGYTRPEPWQWVRLGDIAEIV